MSLWFDHFTEKLARSCLLRQFFDIIVQKKLDIIATFFIDTSVILVTGNYTKAEFYKIDFKAIFFKKEAYTKKY